nr:hypothetical protein DGKKSRWO_DGKKSRWO_CDS_0002 [uncultured phage]CAI9752089.1 hypothetical protein CVNMHQAP_CVNMHQAP_CDS_0002 [uncultured phage]
MSTVLVHQSNNNVWEVNNLGKTSYANRQYEPQTQNTFAFQFLFDDGQVEYIRRKVNKNISPISGKTVSTASYAQALADINEILNVSMQSVNSPTKSIASIAIDFFNTQIKYAGKPTYSDANMTINTLIGLGSKNILSAWADICLDDNTLKGGWARTDIDKIKTLNLKTISDSELLRYIGYKVDGVLLECARDGTVLNQWSYIGMWVSRFTPGNYTMAGANTPSQVSATITVDQIKESETLWREG